METDTNQATPLSFDTRPTDAASVAKLGLCLALGLWVASLLALFGFVLMESLTNFKIGVYGWIVAWGCVSLIQAIFLVTLVTVVKSVNNAKSIADRSSVIFCKPTRDG
jgi:hypothetical protein